MMMIVHKREVCESVQVIIIFWPYFNAEPLYAICRIWRMGKKIEMG